jgi:hypothetical protein
VSAPLSEQQLAEIAARAGAATPGPWCTDDWEIYRGSEPGAGAEWIGETCRAVGRSVEDCANAAFIAAARTDVPALLAEVARLRAAAGTVWLATYEESAPEVIGRYDNRAAAMDHIHHLLSQEEGTTAQAIELRVIWRADDPDSDEPRWDCWLHDTDGGDDYDTGYSVAPVTVAAAYAPPQQNVLPEAGGDRG